MKVSIVAYLDYLIGHLRYGHLEGKLNIPDEDVELFKDNPVEYLNNHPDYRDYLDLVVDDFEIDHVGNIDKVSFKTLTF
jgi:hypothetical protein